MSNRQTAGSQATASNSQQAGTAQVANSSQRACAPHIFHIYTKPMIGGRYDVGITR